mmetsp:Transcript_9223/g.29362  ORF Transcript_9223/g.29362 Transcript_9223/m.29362 type:complete len:87 (+) Transcript_9223:73-333(+)
MRAEELNLRVGSSSSNERQLVSNLRRLRCERSRRTQQCFACPSVGTSARCHMPNEEARGWSKRKDKQSRRPIAYGTYVRAGSESQQ